MSFGNYFSMLDMFPDVDRWSATLSKNLAGQVKTGFRAQRVTFNGAPGTFSTSRTGNGKLNVSSQASLNASTALDMSQGPLSATGKDTDYAIQGAGFFLLEDNKGKLYASRAGEFKVDDLGQLNAGNGLHVVTRSRLIELGKINPLIMNATNAVTLINRNEAGWQRGEEKVLEPNSGLTGVWFPYVTGTGYDESTVSYKEQTVAVKRTFDLGDSPVINAANSTITIRSDDWSHLFINGEQMGAAEATNWLGGPGSPLPHPVTLNMGGPTSGAQFGEFTTYDISKHLRAGINNITVYSSEVRDYEGVNLQGQIAGQAGTTVGAAEAAKWLTRIVGKNAMGSDDVTPEPGPADERFDHTFERGIEDLAIVSFGNPTDLTYSRFGTHIFDFSAAMLPSYEFSSADPRNAKVRRGFIESANTTQQKETAELSMAQRMYTALTGLAQLQLKAISRQIDLIR
ncbi:MAG: hypothetical protein H7338_18305 [Candidatus Sericytochromatia bacterium]|nr:hypothetical protein [Candidatus Sericytochromatia bacterium]